MRSTAVGLNFIDTYHRKGIYPVSLPSGMGLEAAGVIEALGEGVTDWQVGDRVCCFGPTLGAYATARNIEAACLFPIPDDISDETAAAGILKGCTAEFLVERCAKVQPKWNVLVHAAAGGVVVTQEFHPGYGNLIEVDHGNDLVTRYAHASRVMVKKGDLVRRGQVIAEVGSTGRSTGPHLHFEVLVQGVYQDPKKFLDAGKHLPKLAATTLARSSTRAR